MRVTPTSFTIAEYCQQMADRNIVVNRNYQRSNAVWPTAARSFLIDTILSGFPIPKLSLYQKTDLKTRKTTKEIVDGQQRSNSIFEFYEGKLRISTKGDFYGKTYNTLSDDEKQNFIDYSLSVDLFVDATEADIREQFRRLNSYNVPLNPQEKRHSTYQGGFKWFILNQSNKYAQTFKDIRTFTENQLARMDDAKFLADICLAFSDGIVSASEARIDKLYKKFDESFEEECIYEKYISHAINQVISFKDQLGDELIKKYHLYCIILAFIHISYPIDALQSIYQSQGHGITNEERARENLSRLSEAVATQNDGDSRPIREFIDNSAKTTDRERQRKKRFEILCEFIC